MSKFFTKEVKIGLTVIICVTLLVFGINFLKGINLLTPANHYCISYNNVSGLALSAPVNIEGYKVGLVRNISYDVNTGKILVEIGIDDNIKLTKGTTAELLSGQGLSLRLPGRNGDSPEVLWVCLDGLSYESTRVRKVHIQG